MEYRIEHDTLGEVKVPADHMWGAQTQRSSENFKIGARMPEEIIHAFAVLKKCTALANLAEGKLSEEKANVIAEACDEILAGTYKAFDRIPSVREYAARLGVNANTAVKAYDQLSQEGVIFNKRGLGYFVAEDAQRNIKDTRRRAFMKTVIPEMVRQMKLLDISLEDVKEAFAKA